VIELREVVYALNRIARRSADQQQDALEHRDRHAGAFAATTMGSPDGSLSIRSHRLVGISISCPNSRANSPILTRQRRWHRPFPKQRSLSSEAASTSSQQPRSTSDSSLRRSSADAAKNAPPNSGVWPVAAPQECPAARASVPIPDRPSADCLQRVDRLRRMIPRELTLRVAIARALPARRGRSTTSAGASGCRCRMRPTAVRVTASTLSMRRSASSMYCCCSSPVWVGPLDIKRRQRKQ